MSIESSSLSFLKNASIITSCVCSQAKKSAACCQCFNDELRDFLFNSHVKDIHAFMSYNGFELDFVTGSTNLNIPDSENAICHE